jgi:hypothetical protein
MGQQEKLTRSWSSPEPDLAALLLQLIDEVRGLRGDLAARAVRALSRADRKAMEALLPELVRSAASNPAWKNGDWTAREMIDYAATQDPGIMAVLTEYVDSDCEDGMPRRLGNLLSRAQGVTFQGATIECIGVTRGKGLYVLRLV